MQQQQIEIRRDGDTLSVSIPKHVLVQMDDDALERTGKTITDGLKRRRDTARDEFMETIRAGSRN